MSNTEQNTVKCPKCGKKHKLSTTKNILYIRSTGEIAVIDDMPIIPLEKIKKNNLVNGQGMLFYCDKVGKYFALDNIKIIAQIDKISNEEIKF